MDFGTNYFYSTNQYMKECFGDKVYKISISTGFSCPNRDGKIDHRGCIFCSGGGSGEFAASQSKSVSEQIEDAITLVKDKNKSGKYMAYFQSFSNTYGPIDRMRELFFEAARHPGIVGVSIATRPDCLGDDVIELLRELNSICPVWVELGLQTIHERTATYIRRGYDLSVYDTAVRRLRDVGAHVITHLIIGLPGESVEDMLRSVQYVVEQGTNGVKLQLLHVLSGTDLAIDYESGRFEVLDFEKYKRIVAASIMLLPKDIVVHRLTGDGPKKLLIAPVWSADKKRVLNDMNRFFKDNYIFQSRFERDILECLRWIEENE